MQLVSFPKALGYAEGVIPFDAASKTKLKGLIDTRLMVEIV